jgi:AcrR family transcriptional regulator
VKNSLLPLPAGIPATQGRRTQLERNQEAERRLLDAAMHIVAEKGTAGMTLADVGELSGYSRSLAAHYFGSMVKHVQAIVLKRMASSQRKSEGLESVLKMVGEYLRPGQELRVLQRVLFALRIDAMQKESQIKSHMANYYRLCEKFVERQLRTGIKRGEINSTILPKPQATLILCSMQGIIAQWLVDPTGVDLPQLRDATLINLHRFLQADTTAKAENPPARASAGSKPSRNRGHSQARKRSRATSSN